MKRLLINTLPLLLVVGSAGQATDFERQRRQLVDEVRADVQTTRRELGRDALDPSVLEALGRVPRHEFVPQALRQHAYQNRPLPIGHGQTISQPFMVGIMTQTVQLEPAHRVLEIGTGSGYQAAVLSPLAKEVYSIEIVPELGRTAMRTLRRLKYDNVHVKIGDGYKGWAEHAPFDKIIVTCSPEKIPLPLVEQLREGGRMVVPVGERYQQSLYLLTKKAGKLEAEELRPTLFVPMTGKAEQ